jgi:DNA repair exonuclease SbcCD ATPase subunit
MSVLFKQTARVTLEGTLNGRPFTLSRTKTATKGELLFHFDGRDLTTLSVKETQALIEETLGINSNLLSRTMFHGQHGMNDLLEATDAKLKEELSLVVPLVTWQLASTAARSKSRHARKKGDEISGMIQLRKDDVRQASDRLREAMELQQEKGKRYNEAKKKTTEELNEIERRLESTIDQDVSELQAELNLISATIENMESRYRSLLSEQKTALSPLEMQWKDDEEALQNSKSILFKAEQALVSSTMQLDAARAAASRLEQKWSVDLSDGATPKAFVPPEVCPTCHQPIFEDGDKGSHHAIELTMSTEIEYALSALDKAEQHRKTILQHLLDAEESNRMCQESVNASRKEIEKMSIEWASEVSGWEENIKKEKRRQSELTTQVSTVLERSQLASRRDALIADLQMAQSAMEYSDETYRRLADQVSDAEELLKNLESRKRGYAATERVASELAERFGQRGVQTYVLQNAVDSLEALAQTYLDQLSDGGIRLELSLEAGDKITRRAFVLGSDGKFRERPLSTLSGGQWRRCSLALTVGFAELVARRGRLRSSICVLDEPLTHLDRSGRDKFGAVVRGMLRQNQSSNTEHASSSSSTSLSSDQNRVSGFGMSTIIMILQDLAAEELEEEFDCIDTVVRENGQSFVLVDSE